MTGILKAGRGLILLDGVDEVPNHLRESVIHQEIDAIVNTFPNNYFLVSTRPEAVPPDWLAALEFREARINPMSVHDVGRLIGNWHEAVTGQLESMGKPGGNLKKLANDLADLLPDHPPIARLATNPLLCAMICALHRDRGQKLPESQSELCEALCQVLLHRRELESGLELDKFPEPYHRLSYTDKKVVLRDLAYHMVVNGKSTITADEAEKKIAQALRHSPNHSETDAPIIGRCLLERSGMLRESRPGHIDFLHNTFKEYLAAARFVEEDNAGLLAREALDPAWQPVALFAAATEDKTFATTLIEQILPSAWLPTVRLRKRRKSGTQIRHPIRPAHAGFCALPRLGSVPARPASDRTPQPRPQGTLPTAHNGRRRGPGRVWRGRGPVPPLPQGSEGLRSRGLRPRPPPRRRPTGRTMSPRILQ